MSKYQVLKRYANIAAVRNNKRMSTETMLATVEAASHLEARRKVSKSKGIPTLLMTSKKV